MPQNDPMQQIDKDRWFTMAQCYDRMTDYLVPRYHLLQDEIIALLTAGGPLELVVDLGAGSGIFLEKVLRRFPACRGVWVDYSDDFRAVATQRLAPYADRVSFVSSRLEDDWESQIPGRPDAICSMSAIHHLGSDAKRRLYGRCFKLLGLGGWFYNIDEMSTLYDDAYRRTLWYWLDHVERTQVAVPPDLQEHGRLWCEKFKGWKQRNVDNLGRPKQPGDDIHEGYVEQMRWLREAGFVNVDLFVKFQLWSAIGGQRPGV